MEYYNPVTIN